MAMYGKNHYNTIISLQLIKINGKKNAMLKITQASVGHPSLPRVIFLLGFGIASCFLVGSRMVYTSLLQLYPLPFHISGPKQCPLLVLKY